MRSFLKSILLFTIIMIPVYCIYVFLWGSFVPRIIKYNIEYQLGTTGHLHSRIKEVKKNKNVDILFLGSSHAYRGFDTRIFKANGYNTFNLGSSGQTPMQTNILLKRYLKELNPKFVVYEVYAGTFAMDGIESSFDLISNDKKDWPLMDMALQLNNIKVYNTLLYSLERDLLGLTSDFTQPQQENNDTYISGGYVEAKMHYFKNVIYDHKEKWNLRKEQIEAFNKNISILKDQHVPYILVNAPLTRAYYNHFENNNELDSLVKAKGVYYDFNKLISLDDSLHFLDVDHLNQRGVEVFDKKMIEVIRER